MSETTHDGAVALGDRPAKSPDDGLSPAELAAKYGLAVSGARPSLPDYVRQLWSRRHFIAAYSRARVTAMYTKAGLGQLWQVLTPLMNAGVYYLIFGLLLSTDRGVENYPAFLITGVFIFTFTQQSVLSGTRSVADNLGLIRALHFPRACLPIAFTLIQLQQLLVSMGVLLVVVVLTGEVPTLAWLLLFPALCLQALFNTGLAMAMARVGSKIRDMTQLMPFITRTWLYASGVFYSIDHVVDDAPRWAEIVLDLNPAAIYIDLMRFALMESVNSSTVPTHEWALAAGWAVVMAVFGFVYFWKAEESYGRG
ncbi:ABC transporter [Wenjunlia vitaminophila]|uniref:Transport permease protein n=1 Tax=Wenjunlia vitaminophila TaxID=76728 RepID=A0A0T6LPK9_WENVI|nr:ABC transporter permease [Wenjunlia vitaminophila]KRV48042.1 ABC transporter [Wenjunlia vitaminophila]